MKPNWLDRALIISPCYFTLCTTEKLFQKTLKHLKIPRGDWPGFVSNWHADATTHYFENRNEIKVSCVVCIRPLKDRPTAQVFSLLVHEATHIWQEVKTLLGEKSPSAEFEAYAIQGISQQLFEEYERQIK